MELFLIIGGIAAVVAVIIIGVWYYEKKRTEALETVANSLNFSFSRKGSDSLIASLNQFHLFPRGHSKKASNVMHGCVKGIDVTIIGYRYITGGGKSSRMRA